MFDSLIRLVLKSADRVRVGFVSEPVALAAPDMRHRTLRPMSLAQFLKTDHQNGDDDAAAAIERAEGGGYGAVIVAAGATEVLLVDIGTDRAEFTRAFTAEKASRTIVHNSLGGRAILFNPPPPPPPPGHPLWETVARLDATLRVIRVPVMDVSAVKQPVDVVAGGRG